MTQDKGGRQKHGKSSSDQWEESGDQNLLRRGKQYGDNPIRHDVVDVGTKDTMFTDDYWTTGPVGRGSGKPASEGHDTKPVEALSRTSKGQRKTLGSKRGDKYEE